MAALPKIMKYVPNPKQVEAMKAKVKQIDKLIRELQQMDVEMILKDDAPQGQP